MSIVVHFPSYLNPAEMLRSGVHVFFHFRSNAQVFSVGRFVFALHSSMVQRRHQVRVLDERQQGVPDRNRRDAVVGAEGQLGVLRGDPRQTPAPCHDVDDCGALRPPTESSPQQHFKRQRVVAVVGLFGNRHRGRNKRKRKWNDKKTCSLYTTRFSPKTSQTFEHI